MDYLSKHEDKFNFAMYVLNWLIFMIVGFLTFTKTLPWQYGLSLSFVLILNMLIAIRCCGTRTILKYKEKTIELYEKAYKDMKNQCDRLSESYKKYQDNFDIVINALDESKQILPQEKAILSDFRNKSVQTTTAKTIIEFCREITPDDTIFLVRLNHTNSTWYLKVTGKPIDLEQALYILDSVKLETSKFAENDAMVKKPRKIYN